MDETDREAEAAETPIEAWRKEPPRITQEHLAFELRVAVSTVGRWCRGETTPNPEQVAAMERLKPGLVARLFPEAFATEG